MEAVKQGSACVGLTSDKFCVLAGLKRYSLAHRQIQGWTLSKCWILALYRSPSELAHYYKKVFRIDDHMGMVMSGLTADSRALTKYVSPPYILVGQPVSNSWKNPASIFKMTLQGYARSLS